MDKKQTNSPQETAHPKPSILDVAWNRFAQFDRASSKRKLIQYRLHRWAAAISILATLFVIFSAIYPDVFREEERFYEIGRQTINIVLVLLPILGSVMAAFANKFYPGTEWLVLRAGAEQIAKDIYEYRTILQNEPKRRRSVLENRLRDVQNQVYKGLKGEMAIEPYKGPLPPPYDDGSPRADPGFDDMDSEEYFKLRVTDQLNWHTKKVIKAQKERIRLQVWILLVGAAGAFLAALGGMFGGSFSLWVALSTAMTSALIAWQELRNLDMIVRNYSKSVLDLTSISDHWNLLDKNERKREYYRMVRNTEQVLWNQNLEFVRFMEEAFENAKLDEDADSIVNQTLKTGGVNREDSPDEPAAPAADSSSIAETFSASDDLLTSDTPPASDAPSATDESPASDVPPPSSAGGSG